MKYGVIPDRKSNNTAHRVRTIKKRGDFLRASRAPRLSKPGFILQMSKRVPVDGDPARIGFTCSKKVGNAVHRNRAKRRLREIARLCLYQIAKPGYDYVLIGRADATERLPFERLQSDLFKAVQELHRRHP